jgi:hypothetical protein
MEATMPEGLQIIQRREDPYAWALAQAALLRRDAAELNSIDTAGLSEFLEESADAMVSAVRSQMVKLMAHAVRVAMSTNPEITRQWRSECVEFHDRLVGAYRPSMRGKIDIASLWRRATRRIHESFADHSEATPRLPARCPFTLDQLIDADLDLDRLVATIPDPKPAPARRRQVNPAA